MDVTKIRIPTPKRGGFRPSPWENCFSYYAGFSEGFAESVLATAQLSKNDVVFDPWNGSGTTTYVASRLGLSSIGSDLNPVMAIVAKAREISPTEVDTLEPIAKEILSKAKRIREPIWPDDPLLDWFEIETARSLRSLEISLRTMLLGAMTMTLTGVRLENASCLSCLSYLALFDVARQAAKPFQSSNPTHLRKAKSEANKVSASSQFIGSAFIRSMVRLRDSLNGELFLHNEKSRIYVADSAESTKETSSVRFILTSPPYCTRIDYTSATRIQLALCHYLLQGDVGSLSRSMLGSVRVPVCDIVEKGDWGVACLAFLESIRRHKSHASATYYLKTHLDYFDKLNRSLKELSRVLSPGGGALIVVQDSFYKEIHNPLPKIVVEMLRFFDMELVRQEDFLSRSTFSNMRSTPTHNYYRPLAKESVLCFSR